MNSYDPEMKQINDFIEDYITDLQRSTSAYERSKAKTLLRIEDHITPRCREGFVKLVKSNWEFVADVYAQNVFREASLVFLHRPSSLAIRLNPEGRINAKVKIIPHETDLDYEGDWTPVNYSVDEFLSYFNSIQQLDKSDMEAIENL